MVKQVVSSIIVSGCLLIGGGCGPAGAFPTTTVTEIKDGNFIKGIFEQLLNKDFSGVMLGLPKFTSDLEGNQEINDVLEVNWNGGCLPPGCIAQGENGQVVQHDYDFLGGASTELALIKFEDADEGTTPPLHISDQLALWQDFTLHGPTHYAMTFTSDCDSPRTPSPQALQTPTCDTATPPPPPQSIPEPPALALIMIGLFGYAWRQRKKMIIIQC